MTNTAIPIVFEPSLYVDGLAVSWVSTTALAMASGQCRDSTNIFDMVSDDALALSSATSGLGGLDTGAIAASTRYYVHLVTDQVSANPAGMMISLSATAPTLPFGYNAFRRLGTVMTDGSAHFLKFYASGVDNVRYIQYDAPISVTITSSGTSAAYSAMDLSVAVPAANFGRVLMNYAWTVNAAADTLGLTPAGATGDFILVKGLVAAVQQTGQVNILPQLASSVPKVSYKVSAGTLNSLVVEGHEYYL